MHDQHVLVVPRCAYPAGEQGPPLATRHIATCADLVEADRPLLQVQDTNLPLEIKKKSKLTNSCGVSLLPLGVAAHALGGPTRLKRPRCCRLRRRRRRKSCCRPNNNRPPRGAGASCCRVVLFSPAAVQLNRPPALALYRAEPAAPAHGLPQSERHTSHSSLSRPFLL